MGSERVYDVLNLGGGVQSSRILLGSCKGEFPKFDAVVFADTQWEPEGVYRTLEFLKEEASKAGMEVTVRTAGNIREDTLDFRRGNRRKNGRTRWASLPTFIRNVDGSGGRVKRQCTKEYKIEVVHNFIRRELLGLGHYGRVPKGVVVRQWFGISEDECSRAAFPGKYKPKRKVVGKDLVGDDIVTHERIWYAEPYRRNVYPLLNEIWHPDRRIEQFHWLKEREHRSDCLEWLAKHYPDREFPRSACIGCPFRSNREWREMRDHRPAEWEDACQFDDDQRNADRKNAAQRGMLVGESYVHRQMVPLRMVDLGGMGDGRGSGCGSLNDGMDGLCDV